MKTIIAILSIYFIIVNNLYAVVITEENWVQHPEIKKVRKIYKEVEELVNLKKLHSSFKSEECENRSASVKATIYNNKDNITRKYFLVGGTEDSAGEASYYYDKLGTHRFSFISTRAVNNTHSEKRVYFDINGKHLYTDYRLIEGPGWAGGFTETIKNPQDDFQSLCD